MRTQARSVIVDARRCRALSATISAIHRRAVAGGIDAVSAPAAEPRTSSGVSATKSMTPVYGRAKEAAGRAALVPAHAKERRGHECAPLPRAARGARSWLRRGREAP